MLRLDGSYPPRGELAPLAEVRRARPHIVRVGRQNMDTALVEHPLGPVLGSSAESASQRTRRDLHPNAGPRQPPDCRIARLDPGKPLRMSQNRNISRRHYIEEEFLHTGQSNVMRRLDEHITGISKRQNAARTQFRDEILYDVGVRA
jgi:hypothetical protein